MAHTKKSWREKLLDDKGLPQRCPLDAKKALRWGLKAGDIMVVPAPREVDALMKCVPKGKVVTTRELQADLAKKHDAAIACPLMTGISVWIAAHAAEEARQDGAKKITPYLRTLKATGEVNPKYPGGVAGCARKLRAEGHKIVKKGERIFVAGFEKLSSSIS